jgi:predicted secreted hydrolase
MGGALLLLLAGPQASIAPAAAAGVASAGVASLGACAGPAGPSRPSPVGAAIGDKAAPPITGQSAQSRQSAQPRQSGEPSQAGQSAQPEVQLPKDEAAHHEPVEWWYFNGHLAGIGSTGRLYCYGFEYVTFQLLTSAGLTPFYVANFAITDLDRKTFQYQAKVASYPIPAKKDGFALHTGGWSMSGGSGDDDLVADLPGYRVDLHLQTSEPAVLEGNNGAVTMGGLGPSKYYSWTSLLTTGTMVDHGVAIKVVGISWMDHQWGAMDLDGGGGWDWFSVQLTDGQQYMLDFIRNHADHIVTNFGTHISATGQADHLTGTLSERVLASWRSPASGITYGSGWALGVPGGSLTVTPYVRGQELDLRRSLQGNAYWEGDVSVTGDVDGSNVHGVGYAELNSPNAF